MPRAASGADLTFATPLSLAREANVKSKAPLAAYTCYWSFDSNIRTRYMPKRDANVRIGPLARSRSRSCLYAPCQKRKTAKQSVRQHNHDRNQEKPDPEIPVLRIKPGKLIARDHINDGAEESAIKPAATAENEHHQHVGRALEAQDLERDRL